MEMGKLSLPHSNYNQLHPFSGLKRSEVLESYLCSLHVIKSYIQTQKNRSKILPFKSHIYHLKKTLIMWGRGGGSTLAATKATSKIEMPKEMGSLVREVLRMRMSYT